MLANDSDTYEELPSSSFPDEKENDGEVKKIPLYQLQRQRQIKSQKLQF